MKVLIRLGTAAFFFTAWIGWAQPREAPYDPDQAYWHARDLAFQGAYGQARDTLSKILLDFPEYTDVESLLAKTYSWDGNYDRARQHFNRITSRERKREADWLASVKNEVYAGNTSLAIGLANKGLRYLEESAELETLRDALLETASKASGAQATFPGSEGSGGMDTRNFISVSSAAEAFDRVYAPMLYGSVAYKRNTKLGAIIPRINYNDRFGIQGVQYELDLYPRISEKVYAYLNYGYSEADIFPAHRAAAEVYSSFGKALEASLGMRFLDFREQTARLLTGSFGMYRGQYYLNLRPYLSLFKDRKPGVSGSVLARRYLASPQQYIGLRATYGFNPELRQLRSGTELLAETLLFVESLELRFEYQFAPGAGRHRYTAQIGISRQEFVFESGAFFWAFRGGIRYQVGF